MGRATAPAKQAQRALAKTLSLLFFFAIFIEGMSGCVDAVPVEEAKAPACKCAAPAACPADVCDLQIEVSSKTCGGQVGKVEVMVGDTVETEMFETGVPKRTCATIPRGGSTMLRARADTAWQWVEEVVCPPAASGDAQGPTVIRILNCSTATP